MDPCPSPVWPSPCPVALDVRLEGKALVGGEGGGEGEEEEEEEEEEEDEDMRREMVIMM